MAFRSVIAKLTIPQKKVFWRVYVLQEHCVIVFLGIFLCNFYGFIYVFGTTSFTCAITRLLLAMGPCAINAAFLCKIIRVVIIFRSRILKTHVSNFLILSVALRMTNSFTKLKVFFQKFNIVYFLYLF